MKIGTITFHFASNQGAVLQCYALKKYLEEKGYEVQVVDYQPAYHTVRYSTKKNPFMYARGYWRKFNYKKTSRRIYLTIRSFARCMYMNVKNTDRQVEDQYDSFRKKHLNLTRRYRTLGELKKDPPVMDAYITGSDQLWNPEVLDQKFDKAYFLDFGKDDTLRISYAVSIGKEMPEEFQKELHQLCKPLTAISLREYSQDVVAAIGRNVHICIDPTFLLDADVYAEAESKRMESEPYIFVYGFETTPETISAIEEAKKKYNVRVINGSPMRIKYSGESTNVRDYGPDQFLTYIKNAKCVVTNSFHATTFSIIYKKDFITVPHSMRGKRMRDLLGRLELANRLFGDENFNFDEDIAYGRVYDLLKTWKGHSEEFLTLALEGKRGEEIPHYSDDIYSYEKR